MRKQVLNMQTLINKNKEEILSNEKEIKRIEKQIDDKHIDYRVFPSTNKSVNLPVD
ncbi:FbpB family small basic protein [Bacillus sp. EB600]|uniref:FbpB family small basic protein n=1 Tax=Bacillus sp. EB600 TaxID=2806345 RepID=UPI00210CAE94|nr:FbpB family small basic protein [Bacillus sp. EB600]MCQ6279287.1 FbpB family small basic protein [Bacillus sp. EB600]